MEKKLCYTSKTSDCHIFNWGMILYGNDGEHTLHTNRSWHHGI